MKSGGVGAILGVLALGKLAVLAAPGGDAKGVVQELYLVKMP